MISLLSTNENGDRGSKCHRGRNDSVILSVSTFSLYLISSQYQHPSVTQFLVSENEIIVTKCGPVLFKVSHRNHSIKYLIEENV